MTIQAQSLPVHEAALKRIAAYCGRGVIENVRVGKLSIRAAHILSYVIEHENIKTGEVAALMHQSYRTPRSHTMHIRSELLRLAGKGLVQQDTSGKSACWQAAVSATA